MTGSAWSRDGDAIRLAVRLTPRSRRDEIGGLVDTGDGRHALTVRIAAPPVDGAANTALINYLAAVLGLPRSGISLVSGEKSRLKMVRLEGCTEDALQRLLDFGHKADHRQK
jgi:uncharacterized protein